MEIYSTMNHLIEVKIKEKDSNGVPIVVSEFVTRASGVMRAKEKLKPNQYIELKVIK